jgi:hypothetical protein
MRSWPFLTTFSGRTTTSTAKLTTAMISKTCMTRATRPSASLSRCSTGIMCHTLTSRCSPRAWGAGAKVLTLTFLWASTRNRCTHSTDSSTLILATVPTRANSTMRAWTFLQSSRATATSPTHSSTAIICKKYYLLATICRLGLGSAFGGRIEQSISAAWKRNDLRNRIQEILSRKSRREPAQTITANHTEYDGLAESLCIQVLK